ncbi:MAG: YqiA/YcfP family alpha/beta fold hydrolase [Vicinamibacterales bacterium]
MPVGHVLYLHGFASSPGSSKAARFRAELARHGQELTSPDFNAPEFETLTVTRMLDQTREAVEDAPGDRSVAIIGSSLGAFVALHAAAADRTGRIDRLILLAPALDFGGNRLRQLGEHGVGQWRREGSLEVFHYAFGEPRRVGYALYEDAARYDAHAVDLALPILVFQGRRDASVDPAMVEAWAKSRSNVALRMLDDEHQLSASMDGIWRESERFLVGQRRT